MKRLKDITGVTFGRLTAIKPDSVDRSRLIRWICSCSCGRYKTINGSSLRRGLTKSCGCIVKENASRRCSTQQTHGHSKRAEMSGEYRCWANMHQRCCNPKVGSWKYYGERGIKVCERWHSFPDFLDDMGRRPKNHTIDRINNDGNYEPSNCRWATYSEQAYNRRRKGSV